MGPARFFTAAEVGEIAAALAAIDPDVLIARIDDDAIAVAMICPLHGSRPDPDFAEYIAASYAGVARPRSRNRRDWRRPAGVALLSDRAHLESVSDLAAPLLAALDQFLGFEGNDPIAGRPRWKARLESALPELGLGAKAVIELLGAEGTRTGRTPAGHPPSSSKNYLAPNQSPRGDLSPQSPQSPRDDQSDQSPQSPRDDQSDQSPQSPQGDLSPQSPQGNLSPQSPRGDQSDQSPQSPQSPRCNRSRLSKARSCRSLVNSLIAGIDTRSKG